MTCETTGDSIAIKPYSVYKLVKEIKSKDITLPTIQRGFVWRPYQIENLWDSVLRGYPIGAFTASGFTPSKMEILDGQQRATALALAFDDDNRPDSVRGNSDILKADFNKWQIYIDLFKPRRDENGDGDERQYIFRVITKAHPWGYNFWNNKNKLDSAQIHAARQWYIDNKILDELTPYYKHDDLRSFYPWHAVAPVPFRFFLQDNVLKALREANKHNDATGAAKAADLIQGYLKKWLNMDNNAQPVTIKDILPKFYGSSFQTQILKGIKDDPVIDKYFFTIEDIAEAINRFVVKSENVAIFTPPVLSRLEDVKKDDLEKIFVRINTGGTRITNDELNYSLLKYHLKDEPGTKEKHSFIEEIEDRCRSIMPPAIFITVAYRLFQWTKKRDQETLRVDNLTPRQFGRDLTRIIDDIKIIDDFKNFIKTHFFNDDPKDETVELKDYKPGGEVSLFTVYKKLMKLDAGNPLGFPVPLFLNFASKAREFVLLLWLALLEKGLPEPPEKITAAISALYFFNLHRIKSLENIQTMLKSPLVEADRFWSPMLLERALLVLAPHSFPPAEEDPKNWDNDGDFEKKFGFLMRNYDFLLYAQREFIDGWFPEELFELDESMTPYDFDHILPSSFIYKGLGDKFNNLYNSIANLRAWPYELNRGDQDKGLVKFVPWTLNIDWWKTHPYFEKWLQKVSAEELSAEELSAKLRDCLLEASLCGFDPTDSNFWRNPENHKISRETIQDHQKAILKAIKKRLYDIYERWFVEIFDIFQGQVFQKRLDGAGEAEVRPTLNFLKAYFPNIICFVSPCPILNNAFFKQNCFKEVDDKDYININDQFYISSDPDRGPLNANGNIIFRVQLKSDQQPQKKSGLDLGSMGICWEWFNKNEKVHTFSFTLRSWVDGQAKTDLFLEIILALETFYPETVYPDLKLARDFISLLHDDLKKNCLARLKEPDDGPGRKKSFLARIEKLFDLAG